MAQKVGRLLKSWLLDGVYDVKNFEIALIQQFGHATRLFGFHTGRISGPKVGVTSTTVKDQARLFTNYSGSSTRDVNSYDTESGELYLTRPPNLLTHFRV